MGPRLVLLHLNLRLANNDFGLKEIMQERFIVAVIVVSLLAGSAAGQKKYERPAVKTRDAFRGADTVVPTDQTSIGDLKGFDVFKDEELQMLVRTAPIL